MPTKRPLCHLQSCNLTSGLMNSIGFQDANQSTPRSRVFLVRTPLDVCQERDFFAVWLRQSTANMVA
eukprot:6763132-Ditylum_brightwellii.AAC.1